MNLTYMSFHNNYTNPETRIYAIQLAKGNNYWDGPPFPLVLTR